MQLTVFQTPGKIAVVPARSLSDPDIEAAYDSYVGSYAMAGEDYWSEDRFRRKIKNWIFYGSAEGYVGARKQKSGGLKLTVIAGDPNSPNRSKALKRALAMVMAAGKPTWALVSKAIAKLATKAGFIILSPDEVNALFLPGPGGEPPIIPSFSIVDSSSSYKVTSRGTLIVKDLELGANEKWVIVNDDWIEHSISLISDRYEEEGSAFLKDAAELLSRRHRLALPPVLVTANV